MNEIYNRDLVDKGRILNKKKSWRYCLVLLFGMFLSVASFGQTQYTVIPDGGTAGNTNGSGADPVCKYYSSMRYQVVYTAAELSASGMLPSSTITKLAWNVTEVSASLGNYTIKMGHTTAINSSAVNADATTTVKNAFTYAVAAGYNDITFDTNFIWNGTSNIVIDICTGTTNPYGSPHGGVQAKTGITNGSRAARSDSGTQCAATGSAGSTKPYVRFTTAPTSACAGTPTPGNTITSASTTCPANSFNLSLQNATLGSGVSYQWESSPNNTTFTDIAGATTAAISRTASSEAWYRCKVTCSGSTATSTSVKVAISAVLDCYNTNAATSIDDDEISNVTVGTLNNSSTCTSLATGSGSILKRYNNYRGSVAAPDLGRSTPVSFSLTQNSCGGNYGNGFQVYIDYNQNGNFEDTERVYNQQEVVSGTHTKTGSFSVPADALLGNTGMRVVVVETTFPTTTNYANTTYSWGETEDYIVNITPAPACVAPTALASSNVATTTATLSWTASTSSPSSGYDVYYSTTNTAPLAGTTPTVDNHTASPLNATGLTSASTYFWWIRSDCGAETSTWTSGGSFATLCEAATMPYFEGFESAVVPAFPLCASSSHPLTRTTTAIGAAPRTGTKYQNIRWTPTVAKYIYSAPLAFTASTSYDMGAWYLTDGLSGWTSIKLYVNSSASITGATLLTTVNAAVNTAYQKIAGTYIPSSTGTYYFIIEVIHTGGPNDMSIDDMFAEATPSCVAPTALASSNIATTTATLSWTASISSPSNGYDVYYSTTNTAPLAGATPTVNNHTASPLNATGLTSSSTYYWWVRSDCGAENSTWTSGGSFTTLCNATNVPYAENFESAIVPALPNCTASQNVGTGNNWVTINNPGSGFTSNTLKYGYNSSDANAWFYTAGINLVAGKSYLVSYDYGNRSTYAEKMKVAVGTSSVNTAMTTELANYPNIVGAALQSANVTFTPSVSGVYYFGFNAYSIGGQWDLYLDNIKVEAACPTGVWVGTTSNWNTASNWADNVVPEACTNVTVNVAAPMTISSDVSVASITLGASAVVTVGSTGVLNVGNISVATGGNLTINSDGVVLQSSTAANTAVATVKRNSSPLFLMDYTLWSSPVTGQNLRAFSPATLFNRFYSYDTATNVYVQEITTTLDMDTKNFGKGNGYLIRMPNNWVATTGTAAPYEGSFKGTLNNGTVSKPLSLLGTKFNLVGNPYPSPINISTFMSVNASQIEGTLYMWRKKGSAVLPAGSGYVAYNALGQNQVIVGAENGSTIPSTLTHIQTGQGFFVTAKASATAVTFNNTMRESASTEFFKTTVPVEMNRLWLTLSDVTAPVGHMLVGYTDEATQGIDSNFDAPYFNDSPLALTSIINNKEYSIQGRALPFAATDVVPLGFKTDVAGSYSIALSNYDGMFAGNQDVFLKDNVTNQLHNLKTAAYAFTSAVGVFNTRFELRYQGTLDTNNPSLGSSSILIAVKDHQIKINAGSVTMEKVELIDVAGRVIYTLEGINATTATIENLVSSNQMLIVRISTKGNGVVSQKIIF